MSDEDRESGPVELPRMPPRGSDQMNAANEGPPDPILRRAISTLRQPVVLDVAFTDRVMDAVRPTAAAAAGSSYGRRTWSRGLARRLMEPRTVRISPLAGLAVAAGIVAVFSVSLSLGHGRRDTAAPGLEGARAVVRTASSRDPAGFQEVEFVLSAPGASRVSIVGDFNEWNPAATPLRPTARDGLWSVRVPLVPGRHEYVYLVDGVRWVADPSAPPSRSDDFGEPNSVVTVAGHS